MKLKDLVIPENVKLTPPPPLQTFFTFFGGGVYLLQKIERKRFFFIFWRGRLLGGVYLTFSSNLFLLRIRQFEISLKELLGVKCCRKPGMLNQHNKAHFQVCYNLFYSKNNLTLDGSFLSK